MLGGYYRKSRGPFMAHLAKDHKANAVFDVICTFAVINSMESQKYGYTLEEGECDLNQETLASITGLSRSEVRSALGRLCKKGFLLTKEMRIFNQGTSHRKNVYKVAVEGPTGTSRNGLNQVSSQGGAKNSPILKKVISKEGLVKGAAARWAVGLARRIEENRVRRTGHGGGNLEEWGIELEALSRSSVAGNPGPELTCHAILWALEDGFWGPRILSSSIKETSFKTILERYLVYRAQEGDCAVREEEWVHDK